MTEIIPLAEVTAPDVRRLVHGYESARRYEVRVTETAQRTEIVLELTDLPEPFVKRFETSDGMIRWYRSLLGERLSFGAWDGDRLVGLAITQRQDWNDTAIVWELHVERSHQRRGIGRRLLEAVEGRVKQAGLRVVVCETHTPNVEAIAFYRSVGYRIEALDLSYYTNRDLERGEVALFMKKAVAP